MGIVSEKVMMDLKSRCGCDHRYTLVLPWANDRRVTDVMHKVLQVPMDVELDLEGYIDGLVRSVMNTPIAREIGRLNLKMLVEHKRSGRMFGVLRSLVSPDETVRFMIEVDVHEDGTVNLVDEFQRAGRFVVHALLTNVNTADSIRFCNLAGQRVWKTYVNGTSGGLHHEGEV